MVVRIQLDTVEGAPASVAPFWHVVLVVLMKLPAPDNVLLDELRDMHWEHQSFLSLSRGSLHDMFRSMRA